MNEFFVKLQARESICLFLFTGNKSNASAIVGSLIKSIFLYWHVIIFVKGQPLDRIIIWIIDNGK